MSGALWTIVAGFVLAALVLGFALRWWALIAPPVVVVLAHGWEFQGEGLAYAAIAGVLAGCGIATGIALRAWRRRAV